MRALAFISFLATGLIGCSPSASDSPQVPTPPEGPSIVTAPEATVKSGPDVPAPPQPNGDGILTISDVDFSTFSTELAHSLNFKDKESERSVTDKIHLAFKPQNTETRDGHKEYAMTELKGQDGSVLVATATGLADESVKAKQLYVVFKDETLVTYGMKVKCWRADNPDIWQNTPCP